QLAVRPRLLERAVRRLAGEHQRVGQQVDQVSEGDLLLVGPAAVLFEQASEERRLSHEPEHVQGGIGQRQAAADFSVQGHPCPSAERKLRAQLPNSLCAKQLLVIKDLQSSRLGNLSYEPPFGPSPLGADAFGSGFFSSAKFPFHTSWARMAPGGTLSAVV